MPLIKAIKNLHDTFFNHIARLTDGWFISLFARLIFLAVLLLYFWNSGNTKIGEGLFGIFNIQDGAYFQILGEPGLAAYDFDVSKLPWYLHFMVFFGTLSEFVLPLLIVLGLFTRIAAIGMSVFIFVQTYVDIYVHGVDAGTIGKLFDREATSLVMDQRALWIFLLVVLIIKGAGSISLDRILSNAWITRS